jgi:amino acid transporter
MSVAIIALFAALNVRSLASMALSSAGFALLILVPCVLLTVLGLGSWRSNPFVPLTPPGETLASSLGLGLTVAIWFYSGYESLSTMAGEIDEPQRVIPKALLISIPAVIAIYFATGSLEALLVIDVFLFVMSYLLIFAAIVALRIREPDLVRPFRIPVGTAGLAALTSAPALVGLILLVVNGPEYLMWGSACAATGPLAYLLLNRTAARDPRAESADAA